MLSVKKTIQEGMQATANSFGQALEIYWPQPEGGTADPPERNLSMRFSSYLLNKGYFLFGEANHPIRKTARMDVLAISQDRGHYIVAEFKVYKKGSGIYGSSNDVDRIMDFSLHQYKNEKRVGAKRIETTSLCKKRIGVVGGLIETSDRKPPPLKSSRHEELCRKIEGLGGSMEEPVFITNLTSSSGAYWLLYAILP